MTRAASIRLAKDALTVAVTFFLLLLLVFPFLWVVLTSIRPASELFSDEFQLMPSSITLANYRAVFASGFAVWLPDSLVEKGDRQGQSEYS